MPDEAKPLTAAKQDQQAAPAAGSGAPAKTGQHGSDRPATNAKPAPPGGRPAAAQ
ncbi:hypothetical protein GTW43_18935, partial [Streptomyces sp. SID5785]|nr:hypothetical protein [Streptomyces sp. SID5785]